MDWFVTSRCCGSMKNFIKKPRRRLFGTHVYGCCMQRKTMSTHRNRFQSRRGILKIYLTSLSYKLFGKNWSLPTPVFSNGNGINAFI